ncbi:MAG TPA: helix-turn-helix transcriptional regulator [Labilithrix sp.]|nr:helix-turn-helix transcriptional regulator [Labilithrix sp.]
MVARVGVLASPPSLDTRALASVPPFGEGRPVTPEEIKTLRKDLSCTAKELATALGLEQSTVLAWEKGDLFPTKAFVDKMAQLRARGPAAIPKKAKGADPMKVLADPLLWELVRKLAANKKLRDEVAKLAASYPDPAQES